LDGQARRLILCFDGTSNLFDDTNTNVVRLVSYFKKDNLQEQVVYYQTGLGTYIQPGWMMPLVVQIAKVFDQAVAWDISNHIMGGYIFLMQNWTPGTKISIFGFSRGAYTARALAGMLHKVGLLTRGNEEQVPFAFKMYQCENRTGWDMSDGFKHTFCNEVEVDFLGVWETVASVGLFSSKDLPFTSSDHHIRVFRHAISLDERRCKFKANQWQEPYAPPNSNAPGGAKPGSMPPKRESIKPCPQYTIVPGQSRVASMDMDNYHKTDVEEVWFAGGHGDVGGGCMKNMEQNSAARIPLTWMLRELVLTGTEISFDLAALARDGICLPSPIAGPSIVSTQANGMLEAHRELAPENYLSHLDRRYEGDILAPVSDQLKCARSWWALEILPFTYRVPVKKGGLDKWRLSFTPNFGGPRSIPDKRIKVHVSVQERMRKSQYQPKAKWNIEPEWVQ